MHVQDIVHLAQATSFQFVLPQEYGYVFIVATLFALEIIIIGFAFPGKIRGEVFTEQFMKNHFGELHQKQIKQQIKKGGYPDMGNGRYSEKLSYSQWYKFNNAQRVHYNLVESAPSIFAFLFISGLYFPIPSAVLGLVVVISRIIYSIGYVSGGPGGRLIGALLVDLALLGFLGLSFASSIMFAMGKTSV